MDVFNQTLAPLVPGVFSGLTLLLLVPYVVLESGIRKSAATNTELAQKLDEGSRGRTALLSTVEDQAELLAAYAHYPALTRNDLLRSLVAALSLAGSAFLVAETPETHAELEAATVDILMLTGLAGFMLFELALDRASRSSARGVLLHERGVLSRPLVKIWASQASPIQFVGSFIAGLTVGFFGFFVTGFVMIHFKGFAPGDSWPKMYLLFLALAFIIPTTVSAAVLVRRFTPHSLATAKDFQTSTPLADSGDVPEHSASTLALILHFVLGLWIARSLRKHALGTTSRNNHPAMRT